MCTLEKAKKFLLVSSVLIVAAVCWATPSYSTQPGLDQQPDSKQTGPKAQHITAAQTEDKTVLVVGLFQQLSALVAVTMALAGHLTLPAKTKSTKP